MTIRRTLGDDGFDRIVLPNIISPVRDNDFDNDVVAERLRVIFCREKCPLVPLLHFFCDTSELVVKFYDKDDDNGNPNSITRRPTVTYRLLVLSCFISE